MTVVRDFHLAFGGPAPAYPPLRPDPNLIRLRMRLLREEFEETMFELESLIYENDPKQVVELMRKLLKELSDLRYVTEGCAVSLGLPIDQAFREVHRSNMSKLGANGLPIVREDGKVLKGPGYSPANMAQFVPNIIEQED